MVQSLWDSVAPCSGKEESTTTWHRKSAGGTRRINQALDIDMLKEISAGNF
jgi:hypothetical protein